MDPLFLAILSNSVEKVKSMLSTKKARLEADFNGTTPLFAAQEEYFNEALGRGDYRGRPTRVGGKAYQILELLLKAGANPNAIFPNQATGSFLSPYSGLAESNLHEGIKLFLDHGKDLDVMALSAVKTKASMWPLQLAIAKGHTEVALALLSHPSFDASRDPRPLLAAAEGDNLRVLTFLLSLPGTRAILNSHHTDPSIPCTPLSSACYSGHTCIGPLLEAGADPRIPRVKDIPPHFTDTDLPDALLTPMACILSTGANPDLIDALVAAGAKRPTLAKGGTVYVDSRGKELALMDHRAMLGVGRGGGRGKGGGGEEEAAAAATFRVSQGEGGGAVITQGRVQDERMEMMRESQTCAGPQCKQPQPTVGARLLICSRCKAVSFAALNVRGGIGPRTKSRACQCEWGLGLAPHNMNKTICATKTRWG